MERLRRMRVVFWMVAIALGLLHAWMYRHDIRDVDGISYHEMGDAYFRGDWQTAFNGCWSPLYSWILGLALWSLRPSPQWEYPTTLLVNFVIYIAALACFEYLLRELIRSDPAHADQATDGRRGLPGWALLAMGYSLSVWSALYWHHFWLQTPDLALAAFVFVAAGLLLRIRRGGMGWRGRRVRRDSRAGRPDEGGHVPARLCLRRRWGPRDRLLQRRHVRKNRWTAERFSWKAAC